MVKLKTTKDISLKSFYKDKERYSDFLNGILFNGKQVLYPKNISFLDTDVSTNYKNHGLIESFGAMEDILSEIKKNSYLCIVGMENQSVPDYLMPLRLDLYESHVYNSQLKRYRRLKRKKKFKGRLKLEPMLTFVLYFGETKWDESTDLFSLFGPVDERLKKYMNNYHAYIIDIKDLDPEVFRNKDNHDLILAIQRLYAWDKPDIQALEDMHMSEEVLILVATLTGSKEIISLIEKEEGGEVSMCTSIERYANKREADGIRIGEAKGMKIGEAKGMAKAQKSMLIKLLTLKLSSLSNEVIDKINNSDNEHLELMTNSLFHIQSEEDILKLC